MALTFDDGPSPETLDVLQVLSEYGVPATFFQSGVHVERYPEIARQVFAGGHEIGSHGWSHTRLSPRIGPRLHLPTPRFIYRELVRTQRLMKEVYGEAPRLFRPPYGARWFALDAVQQRLGLRAIQWTVLGHDWEWEPERIAAHILSQTSPGAIFCLHDGRDVHPQADLRATIGALRILIPKLLQDGYRFETISQLLAPEPARTAIKSLADVKVVR